MLVVLITAVVVILVNLLSGGGSAKPAAHNHPHTTPSTTPPASPPATVAACSPSVITLALSTASDSYTAGESPTLNGAFSNPSTSACRLTLAPAQQLWAVTSGADKIWTTKGCTTSLSAKTITIKAGRTKTVSISWDGHRLDPGCTAGATALPGEYVLRATLGGIKGQPAVFHVTS